MGGPNFDAKEDRGYNFSGAEALGGSVAERSVHAVLWLSRPFYVAIARSFDLMPRGRERILQVPFVTAQGWE